jgi:hypothetical protein
MGVISTQGIKFQLVANGIILDLFKDEDIKLSNNVTGLFDLGILPADFTRQITLPGSKKNNAFFEHVYDISVYSPDNFATNVKVPCYIDYQGVYLSQGYLQLNKVNVIANKFIDSYEVSIYGSVSSFSREVNRTFLTDMTSSLSQYNHTASLTAITSSWSGDLFNGDIVYPLADYGQQLSFTADPYSGIDSKSGSMAIQDFKPAIRIKRVWDAIFEQYGYTYSGSFWEQSWLDNVYMVCNNKLKYPIFAEADLETYGIGKIGPVTGSANNLMTTAVPLLLPWYNVLQNPNGNFGTNLTWNTSYSSSLRADLNLNFRLTQTSAGYGFPAFKFIIKDFNTGTTVSTINLNTINNYFYQLYLQWASQGLNTPTQTFEVAEQINSDLLTSGSYQFYLQYDWQTQNNFTVTLDPNPDLKSYINITKVPQVGAGWVMNIGANMPYGTRGIKQVEFITGLQKKFNLVMYPSKTVANEFIVESFNNWYDRGLRWDFNKYINLDEKIEVIPANSFAVNELNFGDTLDQDYISLQFSKGANREYGKTYYVDTQNFFSQGKFEVKSAFASSPLTYLPGTGVSGSANQGPVLTGFNVKVYYNPDGETGSICDFYIVYTAYSTSGTLTTGETLYLDAYGNNKLIGYDSVWLETGSATPVYFLDGITGEVGTTTGNTC